MEITKKSLIEIKSLLKTSKEYDLETYYNIIEILRSDKLFDNPILLGKSKDGAAYVIPEKGRLYFSEDTFEYYKSCTKNYEYLSGISPKVLYNYKFIFTLFHELAHLKQADYAYYSKSSYDIINKLYQLIFINGTGDEQHYIENPYEYSHEIDADLEAMDVLLYLFDNIKLKLINNTDYAIHVCNRYYNYESGKVEFLAEKTIRLLGVTDETIKVIHNIPLKVAVHNGLPISDEMLDYLFDKLDDETQSMSKLIGLRRRIKSKKFNNIKGEKIWN